MSNYSFKVKAIIDSANIQEQLKSIKIDPIKIQVDLGGLSGSSSGASNISSGLNKATEAAKEYSAAIDGMRLAREKNANGVNVANIYRSESDAVDRVVTVTKDAITGINNYDSAQKRALANASAMNTLGIRISGLTDEQNKLAKATERYANIEKITDPVQKGREIRSLTADINAASRGTNTFAATLQYMTERFVQIGIYVAIFRKLKSAISDMVETVSSLDSSLVELRKVTDLSDSQLESFTKSAFEAGETLARTGREVVDATTVFSRAGYDIQEAFDLGKSALLLVNTADGISDVADASGALISVLKAFNMEATESTHIVDALNEVSNNYAIDTNNLADILQRVSGTLGQTGTTMEEVFGLAVGGYTTLRNAEMVASGLNMISQRMRGMKEDGEEIEGLVPKIESALQEYANGAVTMWDKQTGELRSTYDVLNDLAKVYPSLSSAQKAYLNEAIAGNRQNKVLVAIMNSWKDVQSAVESASDSTGSAEKENEKYLNSIEGKTKAVESAMQKLASATVDDNLIKWFLDIKKGAIDLTTSIGGLTPLVSLLVAALSSKLAGALKSVGKVIKESATGFGGLTGKLQGAIGAIGVLVTTISVAVSLRNNYISSVEQSAEKTLDLSNSLLEENSSLQELINSYKELGSTGDIATDNEKRKEAKDIQQKIVDLVGDESTALDLVNGKFDNQLSILKDITLEKAKANQGDLEAAKIAADKNIKTQMSGFFGGDIKALTVDFAKYEDIITKYSELTDQITTKSGFAGNKTAFYSTPENLEDAKTLLAFFKEIRDAEQSAGDTSSKYYQSLVDNIKTLEATITPAQKAYDNFAENLAFIDVSNQLKSFSVTSQQSFEDLIYKTVVATNASVEYADIIRKIAEELFPEYSNSISNASDYTSDYISNTDNLKAAVTNLTTTLANMDDVQSSLSSAVTEYNTNGSISYDTMKSLLDLGSDYTKYLSLENGQLVLNKDAIDELTKSKREELIQDLKMAQSSEISDAREQAKKDLFELHEMHLSGIETSERENEINATLDESIISITDAYGNQIAMVSLLGTTSSETTDELTKATEAYEKQSDVLDDAQSAYETLSDAIDEYNKNGVLSVDTLQSLLSLSPEYLQMFFDQAGALGSAEAATMAHVEALKQAKIQEVAASAAAQILAVSQRLVGGAGSAASGGTSSLGNSAATMGNKAATAAPKVGNLATQVANLYSAMGGKIDIDWANEEIANIMSNANKLIGEISNLGVSSLSSRSSGGGGGGGSSRASQQASAIADAKEKLLDTTMKMIKAQKEDQIEALEDELDLEEKLYNAEKKRLEDQIDKYKDVIDAKQKALKLDKEQSEYDDEIADKNKEISDIQNRLTELEFDTSASAMAEKLKLQENLSEKQKDLSESQADREYDLTNQALDDDYEAYKTSQETQIDLLKQGFEATKTDYEDRIQLLKDYLEEEGTIRTDALNMMNTKSAEFYNNLFAWNAKYGDVTNATLQAIIDKAYEVVSISGGSKKSSSKKTSSSKSSTSAASVLANLAKNDLSVSSALSEKLYLKTHHEGLDSGFVGDGLKGNEEFIKALKGEAYATPKQQNDYMEKYLPNMLKNAYVGGMTNVSAGTTMQYDKLLEINVSGSVDSNSVSKIQDTVNQAFGQLTNALSQRGTVRKANAFAT